MFRNFGELVEKVKDNPVKKVMAVAEAGDEAVIEAVVRARNDGLVTPIYVGDEERIRAILKEMGQADNAEIVNALDGTAGQAAVDLVREGKAHVLMKGMMETREFLGPIVKKENELRTDKLMSHVVFFNIPNYPKLLMTTDGGMVMYPDLKQKKEIIENAVFALRAMGYELPKLAVVCAVEKLNRHMPPTLDAAELQRMNQEGEIKGCVVVGPISYDVALDKGIAELKGYDSPYCGDFDCLIMPNIEAGNILGKAYTVTCKSEMAGVIIGAKVPAIMTSRGSCADEKYNSIAMAALIASGMES